MEPQLLSAQTMLKLDTTEDIRRGQVISGEGFLYLVICVLNEWNGYECDLLVETYGKRVLH